MATAWTFQYKCESPIVFDKKDGLYMALLEAGKNNLLVRVEPYSSRWPLYSFIESGQVGYIEREDDV